MYLLQSLLLDKITIIKLVQQIQILSQLASTSTKA
jgi:hypothetical protein